MLSELALRTLSKLPAERAHRIAIWALARGLVHVSARLPRTSLETTVLGMRFPNPIGMAAGFDKNAETADALLGVGAGFVEIGAVTPRPQAGNPQPRLFRLVKDRAIINRLGFNNDGMDAIGDRLRSRRHKLGVVGVNMGANKNSVDRMSDYESVLRRLWGLADFFTVNLSSPNTSQLRDLQGKDALEPLLKRLISARDAMADEACVEATPLLVKIAPDLTEAEIDAIADTCVEMKIDGIIATNTTIARPATLLSAKAQEAGGLSGAPLFAASTAVLRRFHQRTGGEIPLIGVGGVSSADEAYAKIRAGASLVQLYTAFVFQGPEIFNRLQDDLAALLHRDGFERVSDAVGADNT
jgi:dihydroorotate dehydrogenase